MPNSQKTYKAERNRGKAGRKLKPKKGKSHTNKGRAERLSHFFQASNFSSSYRKMRDFNSFLRGFWRVFGKVSVEKEH